MGVGGRGGQCPLTRRITSEVPPHYMPQVQLSLEVLDLEVCHFIQYRPGKGELLPMELEVTVVHRDREWFESYLPIMQKFISDLQDFKKNYASYVDSIIPPAPVKKRSPQKRKNNAMKFMVEDYDVIRDQKLTNKVLRVE